MRAPAKCKFWTLNQTSTLLNPRLQLCMSMIANGKPGRVCVPGDRTAYNRNAELSARFPHNLMWEEYLDYDEYFVPIPVKCLGNLWTDPRVTGIRDCYQSFGMKPIKDFWNPGYGSKGYRARMFTDKSKGYYEILRAEKQNGFNNILIGYSQGGLVARYLAYLDENIFRDEVISAVITVGSPNIGSPMANPVNSRRIVRTLFRFLEKTLLGIPLNLPAGLDTLEKIFDALIEVAYNAQQNAVAARIQSLRKWLSGLENDPNSAFFDLNIDRMQNQNSVLHSVNSNPLRRILHGYVINASNDAAGLIAGLIPGHLIDHIVALAFRSSLHDLTLEWEEAMKESPATQPGRLVADYYVSGTPPPGLNGAPKLLPLAHDFLIPSAYQTFPITQNLFLGSGVSLEADHNSGRDPNEEGGRQNIDTITALLEKLSRMLP